MKILFPIHHYRDPILAFKCGGSYFKHCNLYVSFSSICRKCYRLQKKWLGWTCHVENLLDFATLVGGA